MKLRNLFIGAVAFTAVVAGCSTSPEPSLFTEAATPSSEADDAQPVVTAAPDKTLIDPTDGYVDVGYGTRIPAGGPGDCLGTAVISIGTMDGNTTTEVLLPENLIDMGPSKFAEGEVGYDDQGRVATYTVAAGDVLDAIGKRFCTYNGGLLGTLNGYKGYESIQPGDTLVINPQAVPDFKYKNPYG